TAGLFFHPRAMEPTAAEIPVVDIATLPGFEGAQGMLLLRYLIGCALPESITVAIENNGTPLERARGSLALAPAWLARALTLDEQRWVSACIYARTNHYGVPMRISMRADHPARALQADAEEQRAAPLFEGGFFGNLFVPERPAYACTPDAPLPDAPVLQHRICAQPAFTADDGHTFSACGFLLRGACSDAATFETPEGRYTQVIRVYLDPDSQPLT